MRMTRSNLDRLAAVLRELHGNKNLVIGGDPLAELILTVLSQATNDHNRDRAFASLRAAFPTWEAVAAAPVEAIERAISVGGLARNKAPRIQAIIRSVRSSDDLRRELEARTVDEAIDYLCTLPGVGPKTAACTLLFALGQPAFPVDTHIQRIALRLGLVPAKAGAVKTQAEFNRLLRGSRGGASVREPATPAQLYDLHVNMLTHGRLVCRPTNPRCDACPLAAECDHPPRELKGKRSRRSPGRAVAPAGEVLPPQK
ncbi:MAG: endonuclease III domain-containing protein [Chloroflexota bacterium]